MAFLELDHLEKSFGAANVTFTEVPGPGASKINASVVFPDDPKKRLEVIWHDEAQRTRPSAIVITAVSQWSAPSGMRLGLPLTDVEKRNGKPFMLSGFGADYGGSVSDWQGGKRDQLGGACRMGMRFSEDSGTSAEARARVQGEQVFPSNDPGIRGVKPRVSEIIIGYPQ
mgnify:FL=1